MTDIYKIDALGRVVMSLADFHFIMAGDIGANHQILGGTTFNLVGGAGMETQMVGNATRFHNSWDHQEILASNGSFDITLSSIPFFDSSVRTIEIEVVLRSAVTALSDNAFVLFNNDITLTNYFRQNIAASAGAINVIEDATPSLLSFIPAGSSPANSFFTGMVTICNVNSVNYRKTAFVHGGGQFDVADMRINASGISWNNATAITRIQIRTDNHPTDLLATNSAVRIRLIR